MGPGFLKELPDLVAGGVDVGGLKGRQERKGEQIRLGELLDLHAERHDAQVTAEILVIEKERGLGAGLSEQERDTFDGRGLRWRWRGSGSLFRVRPPAVGCEGWNHILPTGGLSRRIPEPGLRTPGIDHGEGINDLVAETCARGSRFGGDEPFGDTPGLA